MVLTENSPKESGLGVPTLGTELENEPLVSHPSMVCETEIENEVKKSTMVMLGESEYPVRRTVGNLTAIWQGQCLLPNEGNASQRFFLEVDLEPLIL